MSDADAGASRRVIPILEAGASPAGDCSGAEPFALMVLGDAMQPEFDEGDVIVIEPEGLAQDGSFVIAHAGGEWVFRQLVAVGGAWELRALDPRYPALPITNLAAVRGVVIQKSRPGRRRSARRYVP
ncbi:MAG: S24 family peptidase [Betaproteobacteria bacterium]|nr:S24 family peptidase [Betaproteobacteria bacterium]